MLNRKIVFWGMILPAVVFLTFIFLHKSGSSKLVNPLSQPNQVLGASTDAKANVPSPTPDDVPDTPAFNPPKDFQYDSNTNLPQTLDAVNPQVLDSDFAPLDNLTK